MHQYIQFVRCGRFDAVKAYLPVGILGVNPVEIHHVKMYVDVRCELHPLL